jgi:YebC/PmpR family DNA-binding regulatory protein
MAGHSKWKQIKRAKAITDQKRGAQFTKLGREITMAARQGGGDPNGNARLRLALLKAKEGNMPSEIVDRALKKAAGDNDGANLDEVLYEGYGPGGTAVMVEAVTDNRNRTVAEIRTAFGKGGGSMGESGSVGWMFTTRGVISLTLDAKADPDEVALLAIDAGAEDFANEEESLSVYTKPEDLETVRDALEAAGYVSDSADVERVPSTTVQLEEKEALQTLRMLERLEDVDDVQRVFSNADFPEAALEAFNS